MKSRYLRTHLINAVKIGCGSALAIFAAFLLGLPNPSSAGTITLLTLLVETRKQTMKLAGRRILSFFLTVALSFVLFHLVENDYLSFALFMMAEAFVLELAGWQSTLSVNAVIGTHFLISRNFSMEFAFQEFILVLLGISIALGLNFLQSDKWQHDQLVQEYEKAQTEIKSFLLDIGDELEKENVRKDLGDRARKLQDHFRQCLEMAVTLQENSLTAGDEWFVAYFELRYAQSALLDQMQHHMQKSGMPGTAHGMVAGFLRDMGHAVDHDEDPQLEYAFVAAAKEKLAALYAQDASFEDHARLLYILHGMDEMVVLKEEFLEGLTPFQHRAYQQVRGG